MNKNKIKNKGITNNKSMNLSFTSLKTTYNEVRDLIGKKVIISNNYSKGNNKRNKWVEQNRNKIFTLENDSKFPNSKFIYSLKEDETRPKWLFTIKELIILE